MNIIANNQVQFVQEKNLIDLKTAALETPSTSSGITLSSIDTPTEKLNDLFNQAVNEAQQLTLSIDSKELRKLRKLKKGSEKKDRISKSKEKTSIDVVLPETRIMRGVEIEKLRYSQDSIKNATQDGMKLEELIKNMKEKGWKSGTTITVVKMPDEEMVSMDNRRLYAAKTANRDQGFEIEANIYQHYDIAPKKMLAGVIEEYKKGRKLDNIEQLAHGIIPNTYGHCATLRIHTRTGDLNSGNFGYNKDPIIRL